MNKKLRLLGKNKFLILMGVENSQQKRNVNFLSNNFKFHITGKKKVRIMVFVIN